jgi:predicted DNA-binding transcriptional regulator AlpA
MSSSSTRPIGRRSRQLDDQWRRKPDRPIGTPVASDRIVLEPERQRLTQLARSTWWRLEQAGLAPSRRRLSPGRSGWLLSEIESWIASRKSSDSSV